MKKRNESGQAKGKLNAFATHLPILERIFDAVPSIETVLEYGAGPYSTPFFIGKAKHVVSIEEQNRAVFEVMSKKYEEEDRIDLRWIPSIEKAVNVLNGSTRYGMVFVDGETKARLPAIQKAFGRTSIIVAHDSEDKRYRYDEVKMPEGWKEIVCDELTPATTIWTKDGKVINAFRKREK